MAALMHLSYTLGLITSTDLKFSQPIKLVICHFKSGLRPVGLVTGVPLKPVNFSILCMETIGELVMLNQVHMHVISSYSHVCCHKCYLLQIVFLHHRLPTQISRGFKKPICFDLHSRDHSEPTMSFPARCITDGHDGIVINGRMIHP